MNQYFYVKHEQANVYMGLKEFLKFLSDNTDESVTAECGSVFMTHEEFEKMSEDEE